MIHTQYPLTTDIGFHVHLYHSSFVATNQMGLYAQ